MSLSNLKERAKARPNLSIVGQTQPPVAAPAHQSKSLQQQGQMWGHSPLDDGRVERHKMMNEVYAPPDLAGTVLNGFNPFQAEQTIRRKDITPSVNESNTATRFHGTGGLFADCALERDIVSAVVRTYGILAQLPAIGSNIVTHRVGLLTGYNPDATEEPETRCEDGPSGTYTACVLDFPRGFIRRNTQTLELTEIITRLNNGDTSLALVGAPYLPNNGRLSVRNLNTSDMLNVIIRSEMVGAAILIERNVSRTAWQGDPLNNVGTGYAEPVGLDLQITTGIVNSVTSVACPAVDSQVADFEYADVGDANPDDHTIVDEVSEMEHYLWTLARDTGVSPVFWGVYVHPSLWRYLSAVWACMYLTDRCGFPNTTDASIVINTPDNIVMRDRMRSGMFLPVNGRTLPVYTDTGIYEQDNSTTPAELDPGEYASSLYFVPLTIRSNFPVAYVDYNDYRSPIAMAEMAGVQPRNMFWSDDGVFLWSIEQVKSCYEFSVAMEHRIVLRTPHLAGKIENIKYSPIRKVRSPYPGDPTYLGA